VSPVFESSFRDKRADLSPGLSPKTPETTGATNYTQNHSRAAQIAITNKTR